MIGGHQLQYVGFFLSTAGHLSFTDDKSRATVRLPRVHSAGENLFRTSTGPFTDSQR